MSVQPSGVTRRQPPTLTGAFVPDDTISGQIWWIQPVLTVIGLTAFGIYAIWAALQNVPGSGPYLSPFYSPRIAPAGAFAPFLVLWVPLGFRVSCYYYRKAYYRSFFWDPPACARMESPSRHYNGERRFPWILNNLHRFFLYLSIIVIIVLWWDTLRSFYYQGHFGIGLGSIIMLINVIPLSLYTFSCHSFRHLVGGSVACFSCTAAGHVRHGLWQRISILNVRHPVFAWISLFTLWLIDFYIRLLHAGLFQDPRLVF